MLTIYNKHALSSPAHLIQLIKNKHTQHDNKTRDNSKTAG